MPRRHFEFELFRLQIIPQLNLFNFDQSPISSDVEILKLLAHCAQKAFDRTRTTGLSTYRWSIRDFTYDETNTTRPVAGLTMARSTISQTGATVTDTGIAADAISESSPPLATMLHFYFDMARHLVAV